MFPSHDTFARVQETQMLIAETEFVYNKEDGYITRLTIVDKNTYKRSDAVIKAGFDK